MSDDQLRVTIKHFNSERGFGFVIAANYPDVFFHATAVVGITNRDDLARISYSPECR